MNHPRTVADAIAIATNWISASGLRFHAAFIGGSIATAGPGSPYDPTSDIDCYLMVTGDLPTGKIGKFAVDGVLLDVSWLPWQQLASLETHAVLASLLRFGLVTLDRSSELTRLQAAIVAGFDSPEKIAIRMNDMQDRIRGGLAVDSSYASQPKRVMNWLFPATLATHLPLVAACAPLTVRKRFLAAKQVMPPAEYESLLELYGFADILPAQAQRWLDQTQPLFDATAPAATESARFWASDIREDARAIAIGGSQHMIDSGHHREALYWIIATRTRCLTVLEDTDADPAPFLPAFHELTSALQIASADQRAARTHAILHWTANFDHRY